MSDTHSSVECLPFPEIEGVRFVLIPGWGHYAASDDGRIWTCRLTGYSRFSTKWVEKARRVNEDGYPRVLLCNGMVRKTISVHRLILLAFVGPRKNKEEGSHLNGNPLDNRLCNLKYESRKENDNRKVDHGTKLLGVRCHTHKLIDADVVQIRRLLESGITRADIAHRYGISWSTVDFIKKGTTWKHVQ